MTEKVRRYMEQYHMIEPGDLVLAGVSGGADSVCLFFLLKELQKELFFDLSVIHVNHGLRETAERDEQFVRELCERCRVPFDAAQAEVSALAAGQGLSVEEAARLARYDAFFRQAECLRKRTGRPVRLAVAHHSDDQAETVLFHLFRGSSLSGLRGMKPVRAQSGVMIIRPLLCAARREIETYLRERGQAYMTDETNADNRYARNWIRNEILPAAERSLCPEAARHIAKTASELGRLEEFLDTIVSAEYEAIIRRVPSLDALDEHAGGTAGDKALNGLKEQSAPVCLRMDITQFAQKHAYLQGELVYRAIAELAGGRKDIGRTHVESVCALFTMQVGKCVDLPCRVRARRDYDAVELSVRQRQGQKEFGEELSLWEEALEIPGVTVIPGGKCLSARVFSYKKNMKIPQNKYTKWFDYDKIRQCPVVRTRRISDYFYIDDAHKKSVKDYMINEKIKREERQSLCLVCEGRHMLWMPGYRISAYYKIDQETRNVLELVYIGGTEDGGED